MIAPHPQDGPPILPPEPTALDPSLVNVAPSQGANEILSKSEALFRLVWEHSADGMRLTNADGKVIHVNEAFCRLVGKPRDQIEGQSMASIYAPEQQEHIFQMHQQRFAERTIATRFETQVKLWSGKRVWFSLANSFLELEGEPPLLLGIFRDITERRHLEDHFRQAHKMDAVGRLAGGVAHDFNNLLTVILGYSELLLQDTPTTSPSRMMIEEIQKTAQRADDVTRQLLAFSRKTIIQPTILNLNTIVERIEKLLRRLIGADVQLTTNLDHKLPCVKADLTLIEQLIVNLAVNARDAMPQGGSLSIATGAVYLHETQVRGLEDVRPGTYVTLSIKDTGCGMNAQTLAHLFEPFFTTKEVGKGTGLGLAMVYGAVKQSGGFIEVATKPGQGTAFTIFLPATAAPPSGVTPSPVPGEAPRGSETVLVVEDQRELREMMCHVLRLHGYSVLDAGDGDEALRRVQGHTDQIQLLLTDVVMPNKNGREVAETLATQMPGLEVLFISGYTSDSLLRRGVLNKSSAFLQKPFSPDTLLRKVRGMLNKKARVGQAVGV